MAVIARTLHQRLPDLMAMPLSELYLWFVTAKRIGGSDE